jgi:hypothetical protein
MNVDSASASAQALTANRHRSAAAAGATYRLLSARGLRRNEAGNLTAYLYGLPPIEGGWRLQEIERLLFTRYLVEQGHLKS